MAKKKSKPSKRNMVVFNMIMRSAKAGRHPDKKKEKNKRACRGRYT